jgi:hypothetical protein
MTHENTKTKVADYQLLDHGVEGSQYFQGCGVIGTQFESVVTGCGENFAEALDDALDQIAQDGDVDVEDLEKQIREDEGYVGKDWPTKPSATSEAEKWNQDQKDPETGEFDQEFYDSIDCYYYVSIRYSVVAEGESK